MCRFTRVLLERRNYFASKVEIYNTGIMFLKGVMKGLARVLLLVLMGLFDLHMHVNTRSQAHTHTEIHKIYL